MTVQTDSLGISRGVSEKLEVRNSRNRFSLRNLLSAPATL
jgi:hypothetical protein